MARNSSKTSTLVTLTVCMSLAAAQSSGCNPNPCMVEGICLPIPADSFVCLCPEGFGGEFCEIETGVPCTSDPCQNNGTCQDDGNNFVCSCAEGFTGSTCEDMVDSCSGNPCMANGACFPLETDFFCLCPFGFTGKRCEIAPTTVKPTDSETTPRQNMMDSCSGNPCMANGSCFPLGTDFLCLCPFGFTGKRCEIAPTTVKPTDSVTTPRQNMVDSCSGNPCMANGSCFPLGSDFFCLCPFGFTGKRCEIAPTTVEPTDAKTTQKQTTTRAEGTSATISGTAVMTSGTDTTVPLNRTRVGTSVTSEVANVTTAISSSTTVTSGGTTTMTRSRTGTTSDILAVTSGTTATASSTAALPSSTTATESSTTPTPSDTTTMSNGTTATQSDTTTTAIGTTVMASDTRETVNRTTAIATTLGDTTAKLNATTAETDDATANVSSTIVMANITTAATSEKSVTTRGGNATTVGMTTTESNTTVMTNITTTTANGTSSKTNFVTTSSSVTEQTSSPQGGLQCFECNGVSQCTANNIPVRSCPQGQMCFSANITIGLEPATSLPLIRRGCENIATGQRGCVTSRALIAMRPDFLPLQIPVDETSGRACLCDSDNCNININQEDTDILVVQLDTTGLSDGIVLTWNVLGIESNVDGFYVEVQVNFDNEWVTASHFLGTDERMFILSGLQGANVTAVRVVAVDQSKQEVSKSLPLPIRHVESGTKMKETNNRSRNIIGITSALASAIVVISALAAVWLKKRNNQVFQEFDSAGGAIKNGV